MSTSVNDWKYDRISAANRGDNPMVITKLKSGFAVMGDTHPIPARLLCPTLCDDRTDVSGRRCVYEGFRNDVDGFYMLLRYLDSYCDDVFFLAATDFE